jgi:hypothetical protein
MQLAGAPPLSGMHEELAVAAAAETPEAHAESPVTDVGCLAEVGAFAQAIPARGALPWASSPGGKWPSPSMSTAAAEGAAATFRRRAEAAPSEAAGRPLPPP